MSFSEFLVVVIVFLLIFKPETLKALMERIKPAMEDLKQTKDDLKEAVQPAKEMADEVTKPAEELANELIHPLSGGNTENNGTASTQEGKKPEPGEKTQAVKATGTAPDAPVCAPKEAGE